MSVFWNELSFLLPSWVGAFIFSTRLTRRNHFWFRFFVCFCVFTAVQESLLYGLLPTVGADFSQLLNMTMRVLLAFFLFLSIFLTTLVCYQCDFFKAVYASTCGYAIQHICRTVSNCFTMFLNTESLLVQNVSLVIAWLVVYSFVFYFVVYKNRERQLVLDNKFEVMIACLIVIFSIFANSYSSYFISESIGKGFMNLFSGIIAAMGVFLSYLMTQGKAAEIEKTLTQRMLKEQKEQYQFEKKLIDTINIKAHDMKHQISKGGNVNPDAAHQTDELLQEYDANYNTGCAALDIVLTRKSNECIRHHIEITCMADASGLKGIDDLEIYAFFGNLLDNAIEAVRKVPEKEKRVISMTIKNTGNMTLIQESNYCAVTPVFKNGIPLSTKNDDMYHGFGMKSMKSFAESHQGNVKAKIEDNIFSIDVMIQNS